MRNLQELVEEVLHWPKSDHDVLTLMGAQIKLLLDRYNTSRRRFHKRPQYDSLTLLRYNQRHELALKTLPEKPLQWENTDTEKAPVIAEKFEVIDQKSQVIAWQKKRIEVLEGYQRLERHKRFSASSR